MRWRFLAPQTQSQPHAHHTGRPQSPVRVLPKLCLRNTLPILRALRQDGPRWATGQRCSESHVVLRRQKSPNPPWTGSTTGTGWGCKESGASDGPPSKRPGPPGAGLPPAPSGSSVHLVLSLLGLVEGRQAGGREVRGECRGANSASRGPPVRPETRVQNLDQLVGGIPTYVPNLSLDCNTELFNHGLETIWGEISRETDRGAGRPTGVEAEAGSMHA